MTPNEEIYPQIGELANVVEWSKTISGANFPDAVLNGLEKSITFSTSNLPDAPLRHITSAWCKIEQNDSNLPPKANAVTYSSDGDYQRIALTIATSTNTDSQVVPSSGRGNNGLVQNGGFTPNFNNSSHYIVRGINWGGMLGRLVVAFYISDDEPIIIDDVEYISNLYYGLTTWANFKTVAANYIQDGFHVYIAAIWIDDIWVGTKDAQNIRPYAVCPIGLYAQNSTKYNDADGNTSIDFGQFNYGAYLKHNFNNAILGTPVLTWYDVTVIAPRTNTNWLPVFGTGYKCNTAVSAGGCDLNVATNSGGYSLFGVDLTEAPLRNFRSINGSTSGAFSYFTAPLYQMTSANYLDSIAKFEKRAASYGIIIKTNLVSSDQVRRYSLTNLENETNIIVPIIGDNGLFMGDYADNPEAIQDAPNIAGVIAGGTGGIYEYGVDSDDENIDPTVYTDSIDLTRPSLTALDAFNRTFAINKNALDQLAAWLWNADESVFNEIIDGLKLIGENPIEGIINVILFPFDILSKIPSAGASEIKIGRTNSGIQGYRLSDNTAAVIELGNVNFKAQFRDIAPFLDFEPYTQAELYIPFIGKIPISTAIFVGHKIDVKLIVDYMTGAATAVVFCDGIPQIYKQGVVGIQIPITATNSAQYAQSVIGNVINSVSSLAGAAGSAAAGNAGAAVRGGVDTIMSAWQAACVPVMYESAGASSPQTSLYLPMKPYFIVYRPVPKDVNIYGHAVGYATQRTVTVGSCSGFSVFGNVDVTGIGATAEEKAAIKSLLEGGVYI